MNIAFSQNTVGVYLYLLLMNLIGKTVSLFQQSLTLAKEDEMQKNGIVWIVIAIILVGTICFIALQWACSHFAGGKDFSGDFNIMGQSIKIGCK